MARRFRMLLVGADRYLWAVGHSHVDGVDGDGQPRYEDCREELRLSRDGSPGRLHIVFAAGPDRVVADGVHLHLGAVHRVTDGATLNLHLPGVVRALLDAALARGHDFEGRAAVEIDGWTLFDACL